MPAMHPLLERQLTRQGILDLSSPPPVEEWSRFLERVSQTYTEADQDRYRLERTLSISSGEMQAEIAERQRAEEQLKQATADLERQNRRLERVHELFRSIVEQMTILIKTGAEAAELLTLLKMLQVEFDRIDHQPGGPSTNVTP